MERLENMDNNKQVTCPICDSVNNCLHTHHVVYQPEKSVEICELCHRTISPVGKKRIQKEYEKEFLRQLYSELGHASKSNKKEIQKEIDYIIEIGKERFLQRKQQVLEYIKKYFPGLYVDDYGRSIESEELEHKKYKCEDCGRPITHKGRCLKCNRKIKRILPTLLFT